MRVERLTQEIARHLVNRRHVRTTGLGERCGQTDAREYCGATDAAVRFSQRVGESDRRRCDRSSVRWHGPTTAYIISVRSLRTGVQTSPTWLGHRSRVCPRRDAEVLYEVAVQLALVIEPNG